MRNSQHADERLDAEQADDTEEGDPAQHQDEHWLGPEMFVSDPGKDAADPEYADQCELMLEQLQEDVHMLLHQLQQGATRTPSRLIHSVDFVWSNIVSHSICGSRWPRKPWQCGA